MNEGQRQSLLGAIAISSGVAELGTITPQQRAEAFSNLEQFQVYPGRVAASVEMIGCTVLTIPGVGNRLIDITVPGKLYALGILQEFLKVGYSSLNDFDRIQLRSSVVLASRQLFTSSSSDNASCITKDHSSRILSMKIAALLADIAVREFPQRWQTFVTDLFAPFSSGGIWCEADADAGRGTVGVKICLECLKLITEDCTDSDFNAKISTTRRNDILLGMNEVSILILQPLFQLLSKQYGDVIEAKKTIHDMEAYLKLNGRTTAEMTPVERTQYQEQCFRRDAAGEIVADALVTLEKFCQSMPLDWMFNVRNEIDFVAALLHFLQEDVANLQNLSVACLQQLALRKLEQEHWFRLLSSLPAALIAASNVAIAKANEKGIAPNSIEILIEQFEFHKNVSKMGSTLISAHIAYITADKDIATGRGSKFETVSTFLRLLTEIANHNSGVVCGEQINMWVTLLRDPAIVKTKVLSSHLGNVLVAFMKHLVKIRWDDVMEGKHPWASLIDASWSDEEEYEEWLGNLRSKASLLFRSIAFSEPETSVSVIHSKVITLLKLHSTGEPRDKLDPDSNELTSKSTACLEFEGVAQPLENILQGLPSWSIDGRIYDKKRTNIQNKIKPMLSELACMIVGWNPNDIWLKFRRTLLLESLRHYWKYDPSTLGNGVDSLLVYLNATDNPPKIPLSTDIIGLRKKVGVSIVSVAKVVPHLLVPWLAQLSDRAKILLMSGELSPTNEMHLYEFLVVVAAVVENPVDRSNFIMDVLSNAFRLLKSPDVQNAITCVDGFLSFMGIAQISNDPSLVTKHDFVKKVATDFSAMFSSFNQILSVGKRCHEAARARPNGGLPMQNLPILVDESSSHFPDEGPVSLNELAINDPFVHLWPELLPTLTRALDVTLSVWHPECQVSLLRNSIQRYALAISDDEAYLATKQESTIGGVFGEGGTAGSIVTGWHRRDMNLTPKWSGWFNELRNTLFQLLGLLCAQRVLFAPEISHLYPQLVSVISNDEHLRSMEHRHFSQYLKQFIEIMMLCCPATLYQSHLTPVLAPLFQHIQYRFQCSWNPILQSGLFSTDPTKALVSDDCIQVANKLSSCGIDSWFMVYYARGGLFVGDLDAVTAEAAVDKVRVELTRTFSDMIQSVLALKGGWALALANKSKEDQAVRRNDPSKLLTGPKNRISLEGDGPVNADGSMRTPVQLQLDARKLLRIEKICHYLLLENEQIAGFLVITLIQCLEYPDAYSCRRCTRIVHRILETVAWVDRYTELIGHRLLSVAVNNIVKEPKWMIGIEWDMINLIRDIYGRLVLGQYFLPGGQGPGLQQGPDRNCLSHFEQTKVFDKPLLGGGILTVPSDFPRRILLDIGLSQEDITILEKKLRENRSAKDQKDILRDALRVASDKIKETDRRTNRSAESGLLGRACANESLLHQYSCKPNVSELPEKLVTYTMVKKAEEKSQFEETDGLWHGNLFDDLE